ncbi:hypothetical protein [Marinobacter changyiensis]|uniref:hypothetical protein n=1 Tax=Marinobacter changyiensis TaxID=2604091 RepID=UPI001264C415|nr:hypothetical protein [Marinobacter changyiensis]
MKLFSKALLGLALVGAASSASATLYKFEAAYGLTNAQAAEAEFLAGSYNQVKETFNDFTGLGAFGRSDEYDS